MLNERVVFSLISGLFTSEQIPVSVAAQHGLVNYIVPNRTCKGRKLFAFAKRIAKGPTLARTLPTRRYCGPGRSGGIAAADDVMFDLTSHLLESKRFPSAAKVQRRRGVGRGQAAAGPRFRWPLNAFSPNSISQRKTN